ncbi:tRNA (cytidine(34)-2'-O)-methyltransferase [Desulfobacterales bacterium HSG17]|nr:tRNA (cytidine(34)-2'-O)-methyltransferase [Desulfobacterales bacterium HSG17]
MERHVVLMNPEIHWNTGNIGRTCVGTGSHLHLIEPLGFSLSEKQVKRAGLDYWPKVKLSLWPRFETFCEAFSVDRRELCFFSKNGKQSLWELPAAQVRLFLVFGAETKGLPAELMNEYADLLFRIPINNDIRSLNLSTSVGIALYESMRPSV